jgi:Ni,Fe-hydrogenase I cytochrome b subunit
MKKKYTIFHFAIVLTVLILLISGIYSINESLKLPTSAGLGAYATLMGGVVKIVFGLLISLLLLIKRRKK